MDLTPGRLVFPSGQSVGVINETRACCLIANGSGYSMVRSVSPSELSPLQLRLQEKRMRQHLTASPSPLCAPPKTRALLLARGCG